MTRLIDSEAYVDVSLQDLAPLVDPAWRREAEGGRPPQVMVTDVGDPVVGQRLRNPAADGVDDPIGAGVRIIFHNQMAGLGLNPLTELHVALAEAYARWLTASFLPGHPEARGLLYLPAVDAGACLRIVQTYGHLTGVVGAYLTTNGTLQPHDNRLVRVYGEMQDRGMVLAFQPTPSWPDQPFDTLDHYLAFWAIGNPFHQCFSAINWVFHGMPERFPKLRCLFCNAGITWLSFLSHRLDREYLQRPSEAPGLRERPSHYFRRFFYTTHPIDRAQNPAYLEATLGQIGADQFLYGSGFSHWDYDAPDAVGRLTFLNDAQRQAILWGNAARLFGLSAEKGWAR